jgi:transposase
MQNSPYGPMTDRQRTQYPSDLTDAEWALVHPLIPPAKRGGRPRTVSLREILNAIRYKFWAGCQWKALPREFPPRSTVYDYLGLWDRDGTMERIQATLSHEFPRASSLGSIRSLQLSGRETQVRRQKRRSVPDRIVRT